MTKHIHSAGDRVRVLVYYMEAAPGDLGTVEYGTFSGGARVVMDNPVPGDSRYFLAGEIEPAYDQFDAMHAASPEIISEVLERDFPTTNPNQPFNDAQNAAKRAVSKVLGIPQKHVHAGMEAYRVAYRAARIIQKAAG